MAKKESSSKTADAILVYKQGCGIICPFSRHIDYEDDRIKTLDKFIQASRRRRSE